MVTTVLASQSLRPTTALINAPRSNTFVQAGAVVSTFYGRNMRFDLNSERENDLTELTSLLVVTTTRDTHTSHDVLNTTCLSRLCQHQDGWFTITKLRAD